METFKWSRRSLEQLKGIHPDLRKVANLALTLSEVDFIITDGLRTEAEQRELVRKKASRTMRSRHLTGHAIDFVALVNGKVRYDAVHMSRVAFAFKKAAKQLGISIEWGGDWKSFVDTPHIELSRKVYP